MTESQRPNPDVILAEIQREERTATRGQLKIFFGMCPGVGKTYAMLEAAQARKREAADVVIGIVETHGRVETEKLMAGLEVVARKKLDYRGVTLTEMDIDAILARRPRLVLVDELAHNLSQSTNFVDKSVVIERPPSAMTHEATFTFTIRARLVKPVSTISN